jgi:hypothetical protein
MERKSLKGPIIEKLWSSGCDQKAKLRISSRRVVGNGLTSKPTKVRGTFQDVAKNGVIGMKWIIRELRYR